MTAAIASSASTVVSWSAGQGNQRTGSAGGGSAAASGNLSPEDQRTVDKLVETDRKVRAHEQAHMAAAGGLAQGGASFSYQTGPDGKRYAVGGEVSIDVSKGRTPQETIDKARQIRAAALAPADPSGQDRQVAARAARMEMEARQEMSAQPSNATGGEREAQGKGAQAAASYRSVAGFSVTAGFSAFA